MGVKGLWTLLDPAGKPVTLESLEGKILAVDVSIWLHHLLHGMRDRRGDAVPNAHLVGLFTRICKLLFYKIRPVFVFDGGVPELKRQTLAARRQVRSDATERSEEVTRKLLTGLLKRHAVSAALSGSSAGASSSGSSTIGLDGKQRKPDMFELPPLPESSDMHSKEAADFDKVLDMRSAYLDIFTEEFQNPEEVDPDSEDFKSLPPEIRYELLKELKETRKNYRGVHFTDMPDESEDFSKFQLARMMRKSQLTTKLDNVRKEINAHASGDIVQGLTGYDLDENVEARRLVSSDSSHYILIKGLNKQSQESKGADFLVGLDSKQEPAIEKKKPEETKAATTSKIISDEKPNVGKTTSSFPFTPVVYIDDYDDSDMKDITLTTRNVKQKSKPDVIDVSMVPDVIKSKSKPDVITIGSDSETDCVYMEGEAPRVKLENLEPSPGEGGTVPQPTDYTQSGGFIPEDSESEAEPETQAEAGASASVSWASRDFTSVRAAVDHEGSERESDEESDGEESVCNIQEEKGTPSKQGAENIQRVDDDDSACSDVSVTEQGSDVASERIDMNSDVSKEGDDLIRQPEQTLISEPAKPNDMTSEIPDDVIQVEKVKTISKSHPNQTVEKSKLTREHLSSVLDELTKKSLDSEKEKDKTRERADNVNYGAGDTREIAKEAETEGTQEHSDDGNDDDFIEIPSAAQLALRSAPAPESSQDIEEEEDDVSASSNFRTSPVKDNPADREKDVRRMQDLLTMDRELVTEADRLQKERGKLERQAASLNDQIMAEAQELLRLFGMPYIVSPMEAEAQCAELDLSGQTHGTITDDSDIWLFGGNKVYKNMFNQGKYVEFYNINSIKSQLMLNRESLISLAYFCGSDYTPGVVGVGPVTALELLSEFPASNGLEQLRRLKTWWDNASRKPPISETKVKAKLRQLKLKPGFPSASVWAAYVKPVVDHDREKFSWEKPDLDLLRAYALEKFGWSQARTDEALLPVMKRLNEMSYQKHITSFFSVDFEPKNPKSKRVKQVLDRLQGKDVPVTVVSPSKRGANNTQQRKRVRESSTETETLNGKSAKISRKESTTEGSGSRGGRGKRGRGRGRGQRSNGEPRSEETTLKDDVEESQELRDEPSQNEASSSPNSRGVDGQGKGQRGRGQRGQGQRGQGQRGQGRGSRGRAQRGRGVVLAQKQTGGSFKILHCPNRKNVVEEVNLSESSSSEDD